MFLKGLLSKHILHTKNAAYVMDSIFDWETNDFVTYDLTVLAFINGPVNECFGRKFLFNEQNKFRLVKTWGK